MKNNNKVCDYDLPDRLELRSGDASISDTDDFLLFLRGLSFTGSAIGAGDPSVSSIWKCGPGTRYCKLCIRNVAQLKWDIWGWIERGKFAIFNGWDGFWIWRKSEIVANRKWAGGMGTNDVTLPRLRCLVQCVLMSYVKQQKSIVLFLFFYFFSSIHKCICQYQNHTIWHLMKLSSRSDDL